MCTDHAVFSMSALRKRRLECTWAHISAIWDGTVKSVLQCSPWSHHKNMFRKWGNSLLHGQCNGSFGWLNHMKNKIKFIKQLNRYYLTINSTTWKNKLRPFFHVFWVLAVLVYSFSKDLTGVLGVVVFLDVHHQLPALYLRSLPWGASKVLHLTSPLGIP